MTETYTAVLDRIVDGETAVLLLEGGDGTDPGNGGETADTDEADGAGGTDDADRTTDADDPNDAAVRIVDERALDVEALPEAGRHEGAVFEVVVDREDGSLREVTYLESAERDRREAAQDRFDRLSERLPDE